MKKSILNKIPMTIATQECLNLSEQLIDSNIDYLVLVTEEKVEDALILSMLFYHKSKPKEVVHRVFLSKEDYITQDFETKKWRTGSLSNILGYSWYKYCVLVGDSVDVLRDFLQVDSNYLVEVDILQSKIMEQRLSAKHKEVRDRVENRMKFIPKLPKNFGKWINDSVLFKSRYIYYQYKATKKQDGFCTHCNSDVVVIGAKHNGNGKCPNCKSQITYKSIGKAGRVIDFGKASLIQKCNGELVIRHFNVIKNYAIDYRNPTLEYRELQRQFYTDDGSVSSYEYNNFKQTNIMRWCEGVRHNNPYSMFYSKIFDFEETTLYTGNLTTVLKNSFLKYSGLKEFALYKKKDTFPATVYISKYLSYPGLEYLVKLGYFKMAEDIIYSYRTDLDLSDISKIQLKTLKRINGGLNELRTIREAKKVGLELTDDQILFISENLNIEKIIELKEYTTIHKMLKYINSQKREKDRLNYVLSDWVDYIYDCKLLKYDLKNEFILFPRDLRESHKELSGLIKNNKTKLFNELFSDLYNKFYSLYGWKSKDYSIEIPKSFDEVIQEGHKLKHCVGNGTNYGDRVAKGKSVILFLRNNKEIDKPLYTIELDPNRNEILQCRGKSNAGVTNDIEKIINKYKIEKLQKLDIAI